VEQRATSDELHVTSDERGPSPTYQAARERVAFRRRHERGVIRVTGEDRLDWLQGLLTNDVKSFSGPGWTYAAWLTPQGRMITDVAALETGDETWLDVPAPLTQSVAEKLDLMVFAEDVRIDNISERVVSIAVQGPAGANAISGLVPTGVSAIDRGGIAIVRDESHPTVVVRTGTGPDGYVLYSSTTRAAGLEESLAHSGATPLDDETAETLRIESGIPRFLVDMTDETIPLEANLDHAVSHTKGGYVGQEIIVRIRDLAKGRVARRLVGLLPEGTLVPVVGAAIVVDGRSVGRVTSATWSPALGRPIAMAVVHRDAAAPGTAVSIDGVSASVTLLPFDR
jgi:folate-binding protein YgfZ